MTSHEYKLLLDDDEDKTNDVESPLDDDDEEYFVLLQHHKKKQQESKMELETRCLSYAKYCSFTIGLIVGFFTVTANLGLVVMVVSKTTCVSLPYVYVLEDTLILIHLWSLVISVAGASLSFFLRTLVESCLLAASSVKIGMSWEEEGFVFQFLTVMDWFFNIGVFFGVSGSWYLSGIYLGSVPFDEGLRCAGWCLFWYFLSTAAVRALIGERQAHLRSSNALEKHDSNTNKATKVVVQIV